jgi:hypothetical protein
VAIDAHIVGRVQEGSVDARTLPDHRLQEREITTVATANAVIA